LITIISPYLFIIAIEILAIKIRSNKQIKGISVLGKETKMVAHADDITSMLADVESAKMVLKITAQFSGH
jgi:hypothetical protein